MAEVEELEITTGAMTFRGRAAGPEEGRLVLLLHGFPQTSRSWLPTLGALADAGYRAVAFDQRGYSPGARPEDVERYGVAHLVSDVVAVADDIGGHEFDLVGHDWGGVVAWHVAGQYASRVRTLTVVSTPHPEAFRRAVSGEIGGDQAQRSWYMGFFQQPEVPEQALLADGGSGLRGLFAGVPDDAVDDYVRELSQPGALTAALNYYRAVPLAPPPDMEPIVTPTLYVWSSEDVALGREAAEATVDHVRGPYRFEVLEGVSHWIPDVAADRLNPLLLEHLAAYP
ncbi:MAG: alpha/beta hydrolase [Actinobacteria bacterium]|nr:alpha/beta hydrolase [Actinomycetota bacterium]